MPNLRKELEDARLSALTIVSNSSSAIGSRARAADGAPPQEISPGGVRAPPHPGRDARLQPLCRPVWFPPILLVLFRMHNHPTSR